MATGNLDSVETKVTLDGQALDYVYVHLDQYMGMHHTFEIAVNYRHQSKTVWAITVDDIFREKLGKPLRIAMSHPGSGEVNEFDGVVTDIEVVGVNGDQGTVVFYGGSPTILLDRDPAMGAYVDYTLHNIVKDTLDNTGIEVEIDNKPKLESRIPYVARYRESSFAFLSRVLYSFGEWFYYDGKKLIVGNPYSAQLETTKVTFDVELSQVRSRAGIRNLNVRYYDYNATENNYMEEMSGNISRASFPTKASKQVSDPLYPTASKLPIDRAIMGEQDMTRTVRAKQSRNFLGAAEFTATCKTCTIKVGRETVVYLPKTFKDTTFKDLGSFLVLEVHHRIEAPGRYVNTFKGITINSETLPDEHIVTPSAFPEPAVVVANDDPRNQGRVKVRFMWQTQDESTNWVRVQTPDGGSSESVAKNRGFVFIPEVGDQVMVGFLNGHPERPFVMGSLFHRGNTDGATTEKNTVRSIITRSGSLLRFTDSEDENTYKIELRYNDTNGIVLTVKEDEGTMSIQTSKDIYIKAPELIQMEAKKIVMLAEETIQARAEDRIEMVAENTVHLESSDKMELLASNISQEANNEFTMKGSDVVAKADSSMAIDGGSKLDVKAGTLKMNQ